MTELAIVRDAIRAGRWEAVLTGPAGAAPEIEVIHRETPLADLSVTPDGGGGAEGSARWAVSVPIPPALLSDGVQTFLVRSRNGGDTLGHFTIVTGSPLEGDLVAEIELLRAELDMLKRAFRRHCLETGG